jgi:hypothetical protein
MARASTPTLLSLDRWATIMGYSPAAFNQAVSNVVFPPDSACRTLYQHEWQDHNAVSREEIAREIAQAEQDIAEYMGWWPAPRWIAQDVKMYPRFHRPEYYEGSGTNLRFQLKSVKAAYGKIIEPGQRTVSDIIGTPTVGGPATSMIEFDSYLEPAAFPETVTVTQATTETNECEVKVYFTGHNGDPEWEIRPARTKEIDGGVFTATFWKWQFIEPDRWEALPSHEDGGPAPISLDTDVYVDQVDVYREYNDPTAVNAVFYWEGQPSSLSGGVCGICGGAGCPNCTLTVQYGCTTIRDAQMGFLAPSPATYDEDEAEWTSDAWSVCRNPDQIKLYYYCGDLSELNKAGRRCDGLSDQWARIIAHLATARLRRPLCDCSGVSSLVDYLQTDLALGTRESTYTVLWDDLSNPFGTRAGEMQAYRHCRNLVSGRQSGAGAVR